MTLLSSNHATKSLRTQQDFWEEWYMRSLTGHTLSGRLIFWGRYGTEHQCISTQLHRLRGTRKHLNNPRSVTPLAGTCTLVSLLELGAWTTADLASWVLKRCEKKGTQALETQLRVAN